MFGGDSLRKLIVVRIVHTPADMGSMKDGLERDGISKIGRQRWEENQRKIDNFWDEAESEVLSLDVDSSKIRVYQDGLPVAGELGERIVRETADRGSRNYDIIAKLMDRGARIEATESPELLRQEYGFIKGFVEAKSPEERAAAEERYDRVKDELMNKRDSFIAQTIGSTLKEGEVGLLFIGALHNVVPKLDKDIEVKCLD
jgi:hypothetical protein